MRTICICFQKVTRFVICRPACPDFPKNRIEVFAGHGRPDQFFRNFVETDCNVFTKVAVRSSAVKFFFLFFLFYLLKPDQGGGEKKIAPTATKEESLLLLWLLQCWCNFFFTAPFQTPVATGRIVGLSGGGARYTRPTFGLGVLMCLVHQEERRERDKRAKRDG